MMIVLFIVSIGDRRGLVFLMVRNCFLRIVCKEVFGYGCYVSKL